MCGIVTNMERMMESCDSGRHSDSCYAERDLDGRAGLQAVVGNQTFRPLGGLPLIELKSPSVQEGFATWGFLIFCVLAFTYIPLQLLLAIWARSRPYDTPFKPLPGVAGRLIKVEKLNRSTSNLGGGNKSTKDVEAGDASLVENRADENKTNVEGMVSDAAVLGSIDGEWSKATIEGENLTWTVTGDHPFPVRSGEVTTLIERTRTTLLITVCGEDCAAQVKEDGRLYWSHGDIWTRKGLDDATGIPTSIGKAAFDNVASQEGNLTNAPIQVDGSRNKNLDKE